MGIESVNYQCPACGGPLLVMLLVCDVLTAQMRSAVEATEANRYLDNDSIEITHSHDSFDYTTTERIHHESKKN